MTIELDGPWTKSTVETSVFITPTDAPAEYKEKKKQAWSRTRSAVSGFGSSRASAD